MEIVNIKLDEIIPYDGNPRINEKAVDAVANSIKAFGFKQPIVTDGNMVIVLGHTRLLASYKLGLKDAPVIIANDLTPEQCKAFRIADNSSGSVAEWDIELLLQELGDMPSIDFMDYGLNIEAELAKAQGLIVDDNSDKQEGRKQVKVNDDEIIIKIKDMEMKHDIINAVTEVVAGFGQYADMVYTMGDDDE